MRTVDALELVAGEKVEHQHYGVCTVIEVMLQSYGKGLFGVVLNPDTRDGRELLNRHSGFDGNRMLETTVRMMKKVDNNEM